MATGWRHLENTIERSAALGGDAACRYHYCSNLLITDATESETLAKCVRLWYFKLFFRAKWTIASPISAVGLPRRHPREDVRVGVGVGVVEFQLYRPDGLELTARLST